jgi:hypothetical protein
MLLHCRTKTLDWMTNHAPLVQQVCTVSSQPFALKQPSTGAPLSGCLPVHVCVCVCCCCGCVLFFCVSEWVCACVFAFVCCVYSVGTRVCVCCMHDEYMQARARECVCVVYVSMFFMWCVNVWYVCHFAFSVSEFLCKLQYLIIWCDTLEERNDDLLCINLLLS